MGAVPLDATRKTRYQKIPQHDPGYKHGQLPVARREPLKTRVFFREQFPGDDGSDTSFADAETYDQRQQPTANPRSPAATPGHARTSSPPMKVSA